MEMSSRVLKSETRFLRNGEKRRLISGVASLRFHLSLSAASLLPLLSLQQQRSALAALLA